MYPEPLRIMGWKRKESGMRLDSEGSSSEAGRAVGPWGGDSLNKGAEGRSREVE